MGSRENSSCSKALETWDLETLDSSSRDSASHLEEQWRKFSPVLNEEDSTDIVLEDSRELLSLTSPPPGREIIRYEVSVNRRNIEDICLGCGSLQVYTQHPLFEGGICASCKDNFLETLFLYDEDGHQSYCTICCSGDTLFICESPDCTRCYCFECVDILVGPGTSERINAMACWVCFLCLPFARSGLLQRRRQWRHQLKAFYDLEGASPLEMYKTVSAWKRQPMRVLSLFGNIDKELKSLGFLESGSRTEEGRLKYLDDVTNVVRRDVERWGPFDLVYGSTQPLGYSCDHCPGWYMFQFHRILQYARPHPGSQQPFFWIFVDNLLLSEDDQVTAARFFQTEAVTLQDVRGRVLQNAVRVWSNIPGLKSKHSALTPKEEQSLEGHVRTRAKVAAQKTDALVKNCLLPLREYFKYFSQNPLPLYK
ncbi:DNA (cytosine-5)-methyltransferase 3-like [Cricetulus griseus]|uniref:DNA (Cytosine-5)-methyltransferase 3-like n=2 Tax=Cricetulus griseus TaxID=10029 RepID=A0A9J7F5N1_CRIGR|nr:DNA (cytosine-5)-methyltransferase 3-like [Cricetulus griseus]XP_027249972.1 DNA (cytosine-5)-methyltransferase 3-like [Cricetulus griseus]ERE86857.1 DNA (cytosine-5)-methyltransferase 3-like protein [Cricetulus griseus]